MFIQQCKQAIFFHNLGSNNWKMRKLIRKKGNANKKALQFNLQDFILYYKISYGETKPA